MGNQPPPRLVARHSPPAAIPMQSLGGHNPTPANEKSPNGTQNLRKVGLAPGRETAVVKREKLNQMGETLMEN